MSILREKAGYFPLNAQIFCSPFLPGDTRTKIMQQKHKWLRACIWNFATLIKTLKGLLTLHKVSCSHSFSIFYLTLNPFLQCRVVHWKKIKEFLYYNLKSSLLFMDSVQLPQNCKATTRQLYLIIYHYVSFCQKLCEDFKI